MHAGKHSPDSGKYPVQPPDAAPKKLELVLKCDSNGVIDAVVSAITRIDVEHVQFSVIHSGVGPIAKSDLLMAMTALTVVAAFDVVGVVLAVGMLVIPPATAALLTDRLAWMLGLSILVGVAMALGGYGMAAAMDLSIAGSMATAGGALFALAFLAAGEGSSPRLARPCGSAWS